MPVVFTDLPVRAGIHLPKTTDYHYKLKILIGTDAILWEFPVNSTAL